MSKPVFDFDERLHATLSGYSRRFCIQSKTWRGTAQKPGLVAGLVPGGSCDGIIYRICAANASTALEQTDKVELIRDVYERRELPITLSGGQLVQAYAYVTNERSSEYRTYTLSEKIQIISTAHGSNGSCLEYFVNVRQRLLENQVEDAEVNEIYEALREQRLL